MRATSAANGSASHVWEKVVLQRDAAREERDLYLSIIASLVALNDAPRSVHYDRASMFAWDRARSVVEAS